MEKEKQKITLKIAGESFPLSVTPSQEESIRAAVDEINDEINGLKDLNPNIPMEHILRIALLNEEVRLVEALERNEGEYGKLRKEVADLEARLGEYLSR